MPRSATTFAPGRSGNPGGRPKAAQSVRDLARAHTEAAVAVLAEIAADACAKDAARVSAAVALLDRGWGRPLQAVEHSGSDGGPILQSIQVSFIEPAKG
jgi:hypothetical protein